MIKYAKILNKETGLVEVGSGTDNSFYKSIGYTPLDVQQSDIDGNWYLVDKCEMKSDEQKAQEEAERLAMLNLTAADVERAIYKAKGIDFDDIVTTIESTQPSGLDVKALKIELKANNFYRGNPYISAVGALLGLTDEQLNRFFEAGNGEDAETKADAYKYLTTVTFTIEPVPATAEVTINDVKTATAIVPYGSTVEYTVTAEGYLSQSGSMVVVNNTSIDVELEPEPIIEEPETPVEDAENEAENEDTTDTADIPNEVETEADTPEKADTDNFE